MTSEPSAKRACSEKQCVANRNNSKKSTGPKTAEGKSRVRLNALKHGLRAEDVVLLHEDTETFEDLRQMWHEAWQPCTPTRLALVDQMVASTWRINRCVRVETARLAMLGQKAVAAYEERIAMRVAEGVRLIGTDSAKQGLELLNTDREGVEKQIELWMDLAEAAANYPDWTSSYRHHGRLMGLLGHNPEGVVEEVGEVAVGSLRLLLKNSPVLGEYDGEPLDDDDAEVAARLLRAAIGHEIEKLEIRLDRMPSPEVARGRILDMATADDSFEGSATLRYEMQHDRAFKSSLTHLVKLIKSNADLIEPPAIEVPAAPPVASAVIEAEPEPAADPAPIKAISDGSNDPSRWLREATQPRNPAKSDKGMDPRKQQV